MTAVKRSLSIRRESDMVQPVDRGLMMAKVGGEVVVGVRLPGDIVKALDALMPKLRKTELRITGRISRSMVLRLAIIRGLEVLQREHQQ